MDGLNKKAFGGLVFFIIALATLVFLPAWTLDYWQAWVFLALMTVLTFAVTIYLMRNDPKLLERRVSAGPAAEKEKTQIIIQSFATVAFIAVIIVPAFDHRFVWSPVPAGVVIVGNLLIVLGFYIIFRVFKENTFTSGTIEIHQHQKVISTGPYALVRHPMYVGGLVFLLGVPLALGSWCALLTFLPISTAIIWRLLDEEKFLAKNLAGYVEYQLRVKYRLVPCVW
jgi:protein-S-isoprenylcysteine O-methyltransferase Ste14